MEVPEIGQSASDAIDRSRNTRQKTLLLIHVSSTHRQRAASLRAEHIELGCSVFDTCVCLTSRIEEQKDAEISQPERERDGGQPVAKQKTILPKTPQSK